MAGAFIFSGQFAAAELTIISQNVNVDRTDQQVFFDVVFNHARKLEHGGFGRTSC